VVAIREAEGVVPLVKLLEVYTGEATRSAVGTVMNMSRENSCRNIAKEAGVVPLLIKLLYGIDVKAQTSAVGALMNILGL